MKPKLPKPLPGKPMARNLELLSFKNGLLSGIVAYDFGLLGSPPRG